MKKSNTDEYRKYKTYQKHWYEKQSKEKKQTIIKRNVANRQKHGNRRWQIIEEKYGLTKAQYENLLEKQGGLCGLCHSAFNDEHRNLAVVDHCHSTGKIRGIIHWNCNIGLGAFQDDIVKLTQAIDYLRISGGF